MSPVNIKVPAFFREGGLPLFDGGQVVAVDYRVRKVNEQVRVNNQSNLLIFVMNGKKEVELAASRVSVGKGELLFIPRGNYIMNQIVPSADVDYQSLILSLNDELIAQFAAGYLSTLVRENVKCHYFKASVQGHLHVEVQALMSYCFGRGMDANPQLLHLKASALLMHIIEQDGGDGFASMLKRVGQSNVDSFERYIAENALLAISLEEHAERLCMSLSTFKRHFKVHYSQAPAEWFTEQKLEAARRLLLTTTNAVGDVCFLAGFNNASHFTRLFRQRYGASPVRYRQDKLTRLEQTMT